LQADLADGLVELADEIGYFVRWVELLAVVTVIEFTSIGIQIIFLDKYLVDMRVHFIPRERLGYGERDGASLAIEPHSVVDVSLLDFNLHR
jgi:hypothetical protein